VATETDTERAVDRAAKRGTRLSDPRLAALAAERGWELLERRGSLHARPRWRSVVLLAAFAIIAFLEGRQGGVSPIEIVLPLSFWLGVHILERRYQARVARGAEANAELARTAGIPVPAQTPAGEARLPRLAPAAIATASMLVAAAAGYATRPGPYHDRVHVAYVASLNHICSLEHAALVAVPMGRGPDRWSKFLRAELSAHERALAELDRIPVARLRERRNLERIRVNRGAIVAIERDALAAGQLDRHGFYLASARGYGYADRAGGFAAASGARRCL
jgi:hypothetical protein